MSNIKFIKYEKVKEVAKELDKIPVTDIIESRMSPVGPNQYICPFHNDMTPNNFKVNKYKNVWKCYVCNLGGNGVTFAMHFDDLSYTEAVSKLGLEYGYLTEEEYEIITNRKVDKQVKTKTFNAVNKVKKENITAKPEILNLVYEIFSQGYTLLNRPKLSDEHYAHLKNERHLTDIEIEKAGFFTFPNIYVMKPILKRLRLMGYDETILNNVPGFYYNRQHEKYMFNVLKQQKTGIGIPIRNADGLIIGIQVRVDQETTNSKYTWFSSNYDDDNHLYGVSSGSPIAVVYPDIIKYTTVFVTEGYFKALKISKKYNCICLSVQGVHNYKNITKVLKELKTKYIINNVFIAYDSDMSYKTGVLYPALKLGFDILNIDDKTLDYFYISNLFRKRELIKDRAISYIPCMQAFAKHLESRTSEYNVFYCIWDEEYGKGFDDLLDSNNENHLMKLDLIEFFKRTSNLLVVKEETEVKNNNEELPDQYVRQLFKQLILK